MNVHPCITINQMPIICLSIFQLHQLLQQVQKTLFNNNEKSKVYYYKSNKKKSQSKIKKRFLLLTIG